MLHVYQGVLMPNMRSVLESLSSTAFPRFSKSFCTHSLITTESSTVLTISFLSITISDCSLSKPATSVLKSLYSMLISLVNPGSSSYNFRHFHFTDHIVWSMKIIKLRITTLQVDLYKVCFIICILETLLFQNQACSYIQNFPCDWTF